MAKKRVGLTDKHYVALDANATNQSTLAAYGKLIKNGESTPSALGLSHPQGVVGPLNRSMVYGIQVAGRCVRLTDPQEVALPDPDGPADGCGWDPSEFVVWKNLPKSWTTIHFQSQSKPLFSALLARSIESPRRFSALDQVTTDVGTQVKSIVQAWAKMPSAPMNADVLSVLWSNSGEGASFQIGALKLAQSLQGQLGSDISATDITDTLTVSQLILIV